MLNTGALNTDLLIQVSKNIFNKNDNNVGLVRTVKKYGYKKNTANNKIGMGLVMSHTYHRLIRLRGDRVLLKTLRESSDGQQSSSWEIFI